MQKSEFIKLALEGKPVVLVEYRSHKEEEIRYRDKKTGNTVERLIVKHAVEMGAAQVSVSEWLPDGTKRGQAVPPFKKGQMAVLELRGMERQQGFFVAEGDLYPFEDDKPVKA